MIEIGAAFRASETVTPEVTAAALGSGALEVYATPRLVALMEGAAFSYLREHLPPGKSSVGTQINITHTSPTPVGMTVTAEAELIGISENSKMIEFKVTAWDERGIIGSGTHQRAIIDVERFLSKCRAKLDQ